MSDTPRVLGGRYEVGELIGRGGMAEVHLGHDTRLGRQVAIKMLRADLARDNTFLARFRREAQSAAGLNHHAIVAVYDSGEDVFIETGGARVDVPYIVMEYVDGKTLREVLNEEGRLAPDEASRITMGILSALEYSHDKGIVHRDIKPANVMVTRGGSVKVMDFGIARALADVGATMTSAQAVVGTARYLSPEQAQGETVDERSDLYSTGCVLFEFLTGRTPFVGEPVSLVYQHIQDTPQSPSSYEPGVPEALDAVTLHSLRKAREDRYQSAADFRSDLQAARTGAPLSEEATATAAAFGEDPTEALRRRPEAMAPPALNGNGNGGDHTADIAHHEEPPRRTMLWVLAAIVALAAIFGIGYALANSGGDGDDPQVDVPSVVNMTQAQATKKLDDLNFKVQPQEVTNQQAKGTVVGQNPDGGSKAPSGSTVTISVSSGPGQVNLPDVRGKTESQARQILAQRGIKTIEIGDPQDDTKYKKDTVASLTPAQGTDVPGTQTVTLRLSTGMVTIPEDLVGKNASEVQSTLTTLGLKASPKIEITNDRDKEGDVLRLDPGEGEKVPLDSTVTVYYGQLRIVITSTQTPPPSTNSPSTPPPNTDPPTTEPTTPPTSTGGTSSTGFPFP
ncbi:Stk1 family PASTA domain-containing Ser/Thr kinase [Luteipulveratus mongoliensis]|uniref:non-specific serine/threonine protein kinase n=1 Tax=Luteipulveratus mongoliensis TaxID=571913 RepID=A0A0K1JEA8_9MICO|nr:Stk1 family PASTA domain-containing Ser/Thr kinase [Luteipulveratus mongoliensis]AKU14928.1 serine/threonine protein kinase [Luteipulveratus mongoliensis]